VKIFSAKRKVFLDFQCGLVHHLPQFKNSQTLGNLRSIIITLIENSKFRRRMRTPLHYPIKLIAICVCAFVFASGLRAQIYCSNQLPVVSILATDGTALEGTSTGSFTLLRNGSTNDDLLVDLCISGSASNGVDYTTITNQVDIPAGWLAVDIPITPIIDTDVRGNKSVCLKVMTNASYAIGRCRATVEIIDDTFNIPPPTIDLSSPTNGSVFDTPASIVLSADVSDVDTQIVCVSFYANDECIGKTTNSPFSITWTTCRAGCYALFARAVDSLGKSALSCPIDITVSNVTPEVCITGPTNCTDLTEGTNITLCATATDANSGIAAVKFYANNKCIGVATSSPYTINWQIIHPGSYSVQAIAVGQNGVHGYSKMLKVKAYPPQNPKVNSQDNQNSSGKQHGHKD
jgi:Bacterial Ig domain